MEPQSSTTFSRSTSRPPPPIATDPSPSLTRPQPTLASDPSPSSITRPYRLSPSTPRGYAAQPSSLLQRRANATQGLSEVKAAHSGSDPPPPPPPPPPSLPSPRPSNDSPSAYEVLQILPSATQSEIKEAFKRLALQHHPDKAPSDRKVASSVLFVQLQSAYAALKDPEARARYDLQMSLQASQGMPVTPGYCAPSPNVFTPRQSYTAYPYTPRSQVYPPNTANGADPSPIVTPRTPFSAGRCWETDQCW